MNSVAQTVPGFGPIHHAASCKMCKQPLSGKWELLRDPNKDVMSIQISCMFDSDGQPGAVNPYCLNCYSTRSTHNQVLLELNEKKRENISLKSQLQSNANDLKNQLEEKDKNFERLKEQAKEKFDHFKKENAALLSERRNLEDQIAKLGQELLAAKSNTVKEVLTEQGSKARDSPTPSITDSHFQNTDISLISEETRTQLELLDSLLQEFQDAFCLDGKNPQIFSFSSLRDKVISELGRFVKNQVLDRLSDSREGMEKIKERKEQDKKGILESFRQSTEGYSKCNMPEEVIKKLTEPIFQHIDKLDQTIEKSNNFLKRIGEVQIQFEIPEDKLETDHELKKETPTAENSSPVEPKKPEHSSEEKVEPNTTTGDAHPNDPNPKASAADESSKNPSPSIPVPAEESKVSDPETPTKHGNPFSPCNESPAIYAPSTDSEPNPTAKSPTDAQTDNQHSTEKREQHQTRAGEHTA